MILRSTLVLPLALTLSGAPAAPVAPHGAAPPASLPSVDVDEVLARELAEAARLPIPDLWSRSLQLRDAVGFDAEPDLDRALDAAIEKGGLGAHASLFAAACRLQGDAPPAREILEALSPLVSSADVETSRAASGLIANPTLKRVDQETLERLFETLFEVCEDALRDPHARLEAAAAAHLLGGGAEKRRAREQMLSFLSASDAELRAAGALTLARSGEEISGKLAGELERLALVPDANGDLARSYLKQEDIRRLHESRLRALDQLNRENLPREELQRVQSVMQMVRDFHLDGNKFDDQELVNAALDGMLRSLDQHSSYMSSEVFERFNHDLEAEYGGIGAYVGEDPQDGLFTITKPIYSGPAYRAGLGTDDKIVRIGEWSTVGEPVDEIIRRLKGRPGTAVKLYVWHRGMDGALIERPTEDMVIEVTREQIAIPPVQSQMLPGDIGLVELSTFSRVATSELRRHLAELNEAGMRGLVLDLRYNSGGLLTEARDVADVFLERGLTVVSTDSRIERSQTYRTQRNPDIAPDVPMVVLVNRFTASASEIVSGALAEHERATILGERTYGKGSVQTLIPVDGMQDDLFRDENDNRRFDNWEEITHDWDGDGEFDFAPRVKMTIARYLLPSGRSIHRELDRDKNILHEGGIEPDRIVRAERIEAWRVEEQRRITSERLVRSWVEERWEDHRELFTRLAECDLGETASYPGFEALYESLDTPISRDDVRFLVRLEVRRLVQDERGAEYPFGDYQEDRIVQEGVRDVLDALGEGPSSYAEYDAVFPEVTDEDEDEEPRYVADADVGRDRLRDTLALVKEARDGDGQLSMEDLDRVLDVLSELDR